ncbi:DUF433 domain-containing protein [Candidatus Sumerlaeota bacterium]|nr:DUF433 domain-containing protein [Candidatus Sumerlaeota bacterium]
MGWQDYIERNPDVMLGKPVFKGTRLTVELVLEKLGGSVTEDELLRSYPQLRPEHVRAAQAFAAASLSSDEMIFLRESSR